MIGLEVPESRAQCLHGELKTSFSCDGNDLLGVARRPHAIGYLRVGGQMAAECGELKKLLGSGFGACLLRKRIWHDCLAGPREAFQFNFS
jgi:hypothetical protein